MESPLHGAQPLYCHCGDWLIGFHQSKQSFTRAQWKVIKRQPWRRRRVDHQRRGLQLWCVHFPLGLSLCRVKISGPRLICALRSMPTVVRMEPPKRWQGCFAGPIRLQVHSTPGTAVLVAGQPPQPQSSARRAEQPAATSIPPPPRAMWPHGTWWESCVAGAHL